MPLPINSRIEMKKPSGKWSVPIPGALEGRRDDFVEPYFKKANSDQVVVIRKPSEPARIMTAVGTQGQSLAPADGATLGGFAQVLYERQATSMISAKQGRREPT
jgi:hypothetical protein